jgi:hypothetical protein
MIRSDPGQRSAMHVNIDGLQSSIYQKVIDSKQRQLCWKCA